MTTREEMEMFWTDDGMSLNRYTPNVNNIQKAPHYNQGKFEVIDVIEDWKLGFALGNAIKYIARCEHKGNKVEDLKKAKYYIEREIVNCENSQKNKGKK